MPVQSIPYILLLGVLYGTTLLASRFSVGQFEPTIYIGLRLSFAAIGFMLIYIFSSNRPVPRGRDLWRHSVVMGVFGTALPMTFIVTSLKYQSSGISSILITLNPAVTVLLAHFLLPEEKINRQKIFGLFFALSGALLLVLLGENGLPDVPASPTGFILIFSAITIASLMTIYARTYLRDVDTVDSTTIRLWSAAVAVFPLSVVLLGFDLSRVTSEGYFALGWASIVGTFAAMFLSFYIIQKFGATASAMTAYVIPVVAGIGGYFLLHEAFTWGMLAGMLLIGLGITIINRSEHRIPAAGHV